MSETRFVIAHSTTARSSEYVYLILGKPISAHDDVQLLGKGNTPQQNYHTPLLGVLWRCLSNEHRA